jgi:uncharacterized protein (TIGR02145 family)
MKRIVALIIVPVLFGTFILSAQSSLIESKFKDTRDGKEYNIVKIGDQWWMAENLNYEVTDGSWCYDNDPMICNKFGRLYNWEAASKACPAGWHLPSDEDWKILEQNFGIHSNELDKMGWRSFENADQSANYSGFRMIMAGYRPYGDGSFDDIGDDAYFWTSTSYDKIDAWKRTFDDDRSQVGRGFDSKRKGFSVRCLKD